MAQPVPALVSCPHDNIHWRLVLPLQVWIETRRSKASGNSNQLCLLTKLFILWNSHREVSNTVMAKFLTPFSISSSFDSFSKLRLRIPPKMIFFSGLPQFGSTFRTNLYSSWRSAWPRQFRRLSLMFTIIFAVGMWASSAIIYLVILERIFDIALPSSATHELWCCRIRTRLIALTSRKFCCRTRRLHRHYATQREMLYIIITTEWQLAYNASLHLIDRTK